MSLKNESEVSMIASPEFINLSPLDVNPLMSACEIKVLYLGANRNRSYISRATADEMAKTLRGTPIVAAWHEDKGDFGTHGHVMQIEDGEVTFSCRTVPYGFVSPNAEVWYQNFVDADEFGNQVERTYLMTTGYLWTGQFQELTKVIEEGQPHSMELHEPTLGGSWAKVDDSDIEFFIINDATFSKLCILGDDVEPCFEGSAVTSPMVSKDFARSEFNATLFSMMNELRFALQSEGGLGMTNEAKATEAEAVVEEAVAEEAAVDVEPDFEANADADATEAAQAEPVAEDDSAEPVDGGQAGEFAQKEDEEEDDPDGNKAPDEEEESDEPDDEDDKKRPAEHSLEEYAALEGEVESLRAEVAALREFKLRVESERKDALIDKYHMLSAEDKKDIIDRKDEYTLDEIEAKLALLYVEKIVDFETVAGEPESPQEPSAITSFSLDEPVDNIAPSFLTALRQAAR